MSTAIVRKSMLAGLLCAAGLVAVTPARAETWCLRSPGADAGSGVCVFNSAQDCTKAATFGAFGGICEREAFGPRPKADKRQTERKSSGGREGRQDRRQDCGDWWGKGRPVAALAIVNEAVEAIC